MKFFDSKIHKVPNAKREPLYTLHEIADKLGVDYKVLISRIRANSKGHPSPKPVLMSRSRSHMSTGLYMLSEYKVWWEASRLPKEKVNEKDRMGSTTPDARR
jgi:hypothetical protein